MKKTQNKILYRSEYRKNSDIAARHNIEQHKRNSGVKLSRIIGRGYHDFWQFRGRYRVVKGGRGAKKSKTTALNLIARMMTHDGANTLVVRKVYQTLKDSCYAELRWAIRKLGVEHLWKIKQSPLEMEYQGRKILFRGLDDPLKVSSIAVENGILCWLWIEEAFEVDEEDFEALDECLRGKTEDFEDNRDAIIFEENHPHKP